MDRYTAVPAGNSIKIYNADNGNYRASIFIEADINIINVQTTPEYINVTYTTKSGASYLRVFSTQSLSYIKTVLL